MADYYYDDDDYEDDFDDFDDYYINEYYINEYDDLYDDVVEDAGYDVWDFACLEEYNFDEERYLYEFIPEDVYEDPSLNRFQTVSYQDLVDLSDMTKKLVNAWKKRKDDSSSKIIDVDRKSFSFRGGSNLYQLDEEDRELLRAWSVQELLLRLGGNEEVLHFETKISDAANFVNRTMLRFLSSCFPLMPYPVLRIILAHLIKQAGMKNFESLTENPDEEGRLIVKMYSALSKIFVNLKVLMFDAEANVEIEDFTVRIHKLEETLLEFSSFVQSSFSLMEGEQDNSFE